MCKFRGFTCTYPPGIITLLYAKRQNGERGENDVMCARVSLPCLGGVLLGALNSKLGFFPVL